MKPKNINFRVKNIIAPINRNLLEQELKNSSYLRSTNFGDNDIYIFDNFQAPNLMLEVGRLREIAFRSGGGGTGKECDIDDYDTSSDPYKQLIVWDREKKEILGGYRYKLGKNLGTDSQGNPKIATSKLFKFSKEYIDNFLPYTIELGRSFVRMELVKAQGVRKSIFALDNLWDGLGSLILRHPEIKYFMGKVTMYQSYNEHARDLILFFLNKHFEDKNKLITPIYSLDYKTDTSKFSEIFISSGFKDDYNILSKNVRATGEVIPPLINSYINLSPSMKTFGTSLNKDFGEVEETGIMITIGDIYDSKKRRHLS